MGRSIPLFRVYHTEAMEARVVEVLRSGALASGSNVDRFTQAFAELVGAPGVVLISDMSSSIQMALEMTGVGAGDEVLTTAYACMSTNAPIARVGARPAWVDVDPATATVDLESLERALTSRTKALLLYHVAGYSGPGVEARAFCEAHGLTLIEDCDNALLATYKGRQVGTFGRFAVHSFYPNRQLQTLEGGALVCECEEDRKRALRLRRFGIDQQAFRMTDGEINPQCDIPEIGMPATLSNVSAALGLEQVATVYQRIEAARRIAAIYDQAFAATPGIQPVRPLPGAAPSYWVYLLRVGKGRDALLEALKQSGIGASKLHYLNSAYSGFGVVAPPLPGSRALMDSILGIPCGWWVTEEDAAAVIRTIAEHRGLGSLHV